LAVGAKTLALIQLGRFGEVLEIIRNGREIAEKNGNDPWVFVFREAWLRTLCFDFEGVRHLSKIIMRLNPEQHAVQPRTIAMAASGYAELDRQKYDEALDYFAQVRDRKATPNFFLHWYWRMHAQLGSARVWLRSRKPYQCRLRSRPISRCRTFDRCPEFAGNRLGHEGASRHRDEEME